MLKTLRKFMCDERAATMIEYAIIGALASITIVGAVTLIGTRLSTKFLGPVASGLS